MVLMAVIPFLTKSDSRQLQWFNEATRDSSFGLLAPRWGPSALAGAVWHTQGGSSRIRTRSVEGPLVNAAPVSPPGVDPRWHPIVRVAGIAAVIVTVLIPVQALVFILFPPPASVAEYFDLFQHNPVPGLLDLDLLLTLDYLVMIPFYLALFALIERAARGWAALALVLGLFSLVLFLVSREATFSMWMLSSQYASAHSPADQAALTGAGQTLLTLYNGSSFGVGYVLGAISTLIFSAVMMRQRVFGRMPGIVGIITGVTVLVPPNLGPIGIVVAMLSLIPTVLWLILLSRGLFGLARGVASST